MNLFFRKTNQEAETQKSIHNGAEIFEVIKEKLNGAQKTIKIAAAWFTDPELFQIISSKLDQNRNLQVEIVLDNNKENYWLPFMELVKKGASVRLSKGLGENGRMHDKFCIIDEEVLISGSYNWSKNARTENHENVIVTPIKETINEFNEKFNKLFAGSTSYTSENVEELNLTTDEVLQEINTQESFTREFEKVLDEMIYSSVVEYDRDSLQEKGYERSAKCLGDANIITNEMDTVYTEMLNSISVSEQKKELIKAKVNTHLSENKLKVSDRFDREKEQILLEEDATTKKLKHEISFLKDNINTLQEDINKIEKSDILNFEDKIRFLKEQKRSTEDEILKMPFRWYVDIPTYLGLIFVFIYILLFYSSAAYILMFSEKNASMAKKLQIPVEEIGIYYSKSIPNAYKSGFSELLFILLFPVFLICGIIYLKKIQPQKFVPTWLIKLLCLIVIDGFTAIAVTKSIHETKYAAGAEKEHFHIGSIFSDTNFYLVFIFGVLALLVFDLIISYIIKNIQSRNDVHIKVKNKVRIEEINEEILNLHKEITISNTTVINKKALVEHNKYLISNIEKNIENLPLISKRKSTLLENEKNNQIINLENIVTIALSKVDNEIFSFSPHFMSDRINTFLQGWNNFIYSYYAKSIAESKINDAKLNSGNWFSQHFSN